MKPLFLFLLAATIVPTTFGAKATVTYRNEAYDIIGVKNESVTARINNRTKTMRAERIRIVDDPSNRLPGTFAELNNLLVTLKPKGTRALIIEADIKPSSNLTDCYLVLVSGSSNDVNTVARALPDLSANQFSKVSLRIKTNKFTKMEPYQLCLFSGEKSIVLNNGDDIIGGRITPYEQMPRALFQVESIFPDSLKDQYSQATVMMEFTIGVDGNASKITAVKSPHELFSKSAEESLRRSRFTPRYSQGVPKSTRINQTFVFRNQKQSDSEELEE